MQMMRYLSDTNIYILSIIRLDFSDKAPYVYLPQETINYDQDPIPSRTHMHLFLKIYTKNEQNEQIYHS